MNWQDAALVSAGVVGSCVAVVHGILVQRLMVRPVEALLAAGGRMGAPVRRIIPLLLHFSTVVWFLGGLALIAAAIWSGQDTRRATGLFVGSVYLFGAVGNLWATRARHPGWMTLPGNGDYVQADGGDTRNYFGSLQGLPEARALFAGMMAAPPERILIGNNASLSLMHDCIVFALLKGVPGGSRPWSADQPIAFLCPSPGYDRHFALCEEYGIHDRRRA
jgi:hypothetical protein